MTNQSETFLIGTNDPSASEVAVLTNLQVTTAMMFAVGLYLLAALLIF